MSAKKPTAKPSLKQGAIPSAPAAETRQNLFGGSPLVDLNNKAAVLVVAVEGLRQIANDGSALDDTFLIPVALLAQDVHFMTEDALKFQAVLESRVHSLQATAGASAGKGGVR